MSPTSPRRPGTARSRGVVASCLVAVLVSGCSGIEVDGPDLDAADASACRDLVADLPETLVDQERREVDDAERGAAWGDPAIVLVCGAETPEAFDEFSTCTEADGIGWFIPDEEVEDQSSAVTMTTVGHDPMVSVTLPASYRPPVPPPRCPGSPRRCAATPRRSSPAREAGEPRRVGAAAQRRPVPRCSARLISRSTSSA